MAKTVFFPKKQTLLCGYYRGIYRNMVRAQINSTIPRSVEPPRQKKQTIWKVRQTNDLNKLKISNPPRNTKNNTTTLSLKSTLLGWYTLQSPQKNFTFSDEIRRVHSYFRPFAKKLNMRVVTIPFQSQSQALAIVCGTTMQLRRQMLFIVFKYKHCKGLRKTKKLAVQRTEGSTAGFFRLRWQICNGPYQNQAPEAPRRQTSNSRILCFLVEGSVYRDRDT